MSRIRPDFSREREFAVSGKTLIAGIDEAGRGALAGPLAVSAVIFSADDILSGKDFPFVNDSKKMTEAAREISFDKIKAAALYSATVLIENGQIDSTNVNIATRSAIDRLLEVLPVLPDILLIDGNFRFTFKVPSVSIKKGDSVSLSIAAASVLSKVTRDRKMNELSVEFPRYAFEVHKGYGTAKHLANLKEHGASPIHRVSYSPVAKVLRGE